MTRKNLIIITAAVTGALCIAVLAAQASRRAALAQSIEAESKTVAALGQSVSPDEAIAPDGAPGPTDPAISAERIDSAVARVDEIAASFGKGRVKMEELLRDLPALLTEIDDFSIDEVLALADRIDAPLSDNSGGAKNQLKTILLLVAADHDPVSVLEREDVRTGSSITAIALGNLTKRNPGAALDWLEKADLEELANAQLRKVVLSQVLRDDFEAGLALLRADSENMTQALATLSETPFPEKSIGQAVVSMRREENAELIPAIVSMIINSVGLRRGVAGAREAAETYQLPEAEVAKFLMETSRSFGTNEAGTTIGWMLDVQTSDQQQHAVPRLIGMWARNDFNAAGKFLGNMEPSATRDLSIEKFSEIVAALDPEAAATWALEIENQELRQEALEGVVQRWRTSAPSAADAWLRENAP